VGIGAHWPIRSTTAVSRAPGAAGHEISRRQAYNEDVEALEWIMDVVRNDADPQIDLSFAPISPD
jgi:hypothetical protein